MTLFRFSIFINLAFLLVSCEDLIDIDLNRANPKIVIEANLNDLSTKQTVHISRTVDFDSPISSEPVTGATVSVTDNKGKTYLFVDRGNGQYIREGFKPEGGLVYNLAVDVEGEIYTASTKMNVFVPVDSLAVKEESIFNETYYSVILKFEDPKDVSNYYKYDVSINGGDFKFAYTFNDKFNDGLYVSHQVADRNNSLTLGDSVIIRRQCVSREIYTYWNQIQMLNPGSAAPANPTSNISNGALGYFSVSSAKDYGVRIIEVTD